MSINQKYLAYLKRAVYIFLMPFKRRKPINIRGRFKLHDKTKVYKAKHTIEEVAAFAQKCRAERLSNPTTAENRITDILKSLGIDFEREKIRFYNDGQNFIIHDFFIASRDTIIEADGAGHHLQAKHDAGRDKFMLDQGIRTLRYQNREILCRGFKQILANALGIIEL